jgi:uncharacterized protein YutE (UPF0331/DUF86 family)
MRIDDKVEEIERLLDELATIVPTSQDDYASDLKTRAACERYFERIVSVIVDAAFLVVKSRGIKAPEDEKAIFDALATADIITPDLARRLKEAKGMRNILAHEYGVVDDEIVFHAITEELEKDAREFVTAVRTARDN